MMKHTKQDILETALTLFSQRGYSAVSIRDICKMVGIKESTVYYHFKNKQDIFDTLLRQFETITQALQDRFDTELAGITEITKESFTAVGLAILNTYFLDGQILKFIHMLMIEQHVSHKAADLYHRILFEHPLAQHAEVFQTLMQRGYFRKGDIHFLAEEYYAPILFIFQLYFAGGTLTGDRRKEANERLAAHLACFYDRYSISDREEGEIDERLQEQKSKE